MRVYSGGPLDVPNETMAQMFHRTARNHAEKVGYRGRPGKGLPFQDMTWRQTEAACDEIANGFLANGAAPHERVALLAETSAWWSLADFAILSVGGVTVTVYPTLTPEQIGYLLNDSGTTMIVLDGQAALDKVAQIHAKVPKLRRIVTFEPCNVPADLQKITTTLDVFREEGRAFAALNPGKLAERLAQSRPEDVATIVYTSGTTGVPKGAVLTHRNFVSATRAARKLLDLDASFAKHPQASTTVFLPMAHCYGRIHALMGVDMGVPVAFGATNSLVEDFKATKPFMIASVPRLYERMYAQMLKAVEEGSPAKKRIFYAAAATAREYGHAISNGGQAGLGLRVRHAIFDRLVYHKLRAALGMEYMEACTTGAAAIRTDLLYFFQGVGIPILEGYGLTETSAPSNVNPPHKFKPGTVGPPFPGMEMTLAEDGEILMKGPNIFQGYHNLPKETAEAFNAEGWFKTGDIGAFDEDGYLKIVDRKKELEVLNTGKKIAPVMVEEKLKVNPLVGEALFVATDRKYGACLIQPNFDALVAWAKKEGIAFDGSKVVIKPDPTGQPMTYSVGRDLLDNPRTKALYQQIVDEMNRTLADFEQVRSFAFADNVFSMDRDEMTMTLKKKRRVIAKNYHDVIEGMFSRGST
ncbi:MAG: long-chain acyl-CoA synthetase [Thermoplasmata archaeon]|jgi:long-chain acyl-CoA synthetase|nr:long-chain acyl-CoA synthetase [Thermoplasmata archaeon]